MELQMDRFGRGETFNINGRLTIEFHDDYEHHSDEMEYVVENVLQNTNTDSPSFDSLRNEFNSIYENSCACSLEHPNQSDGMCSECSHGGNFVGIRTGGDDQMELILNENRKSHDVIYECCDLCACPTTCKNRLVQFGPRKHLQIVRFPRKQLGLITLKSIPEGAFICEYAGELLTRNEAMRRLRRNDADNEMNYLICLNERSLDDANGIESSGKIETFVDPSRVGNIGRYLNHSCDPNCKIISVRTNGSIPKLAIFSRRHIEANEELCFDYGESESSMEQSAVTSANRKPCYCGSARCRRFLPNLSIA